ncbi:hypothetical protein PVL30_001767 [Lodderomyces elongisporus]|uniref:uncharacterized protein n=1 Tax=Lodderomyces elongisporus TaxID=36914 RepID=UPI002921E130|nr:uncharacterized protein PVL30_001767 [Lodderomyces elongisporus]WLF78041.1 hypothetical protein PVL30_001767 [Lodderomyces elongisporus]
MLKHNIIALILFLSCTVICHTIPGIDSLHAQTLDKRNVDIEAVYENMDIDDTDFISYHLREIAKFNGTKCENCKSRIRYSQNLLQEQEDKKHLISLLLYKYCLNANNQSYTKCNNIDLFVTTDAKNFETNQGWESGTSTASSLNFWDNDFLHLLANFNTSSDLDLEYYCFFKQSACPLPKTQDVEELYGVSNWWPEKQPKHYSEPQYNQENLERFNVLHISDFHLQQRYQVGAESNCTSAPCALPESYNAVLPKSDYNFTTAFKKANPGIDVGDIRFSFYPYAHYDENDQYTPGEYYDYPKYRGWNFNNFPATTFGSYLSDSPEILLNNSLNYISKAHSNDSFEFAIFTGDLVDHDKIHCTPNLTKEEEVKSLKIMKHYLKNLTVLPALGNHDTFPYGQLSPIKYDFNNSYDWTSDLMADLWVGNGWFNETQGDTIRSHYAGFSYVTKRGLKIVGLNSNCYYQKNLWSYINLESDGDIFGQWKFLIDELVESEQRGQRVWIMAHIPVSDYDALPLQSRIFGKIVERFSPYTIAGIFYGHTHRDIFSVLYNDDGDDNKEPINMAWISQSITPYSNFNPSWRYYEVEDQSFNILNAYNYYTKLNNTFINAGAEPAWEFEYSARTFYDPQDTWGSNNPLNATFWNRYVAEKLGNKSEIGFNQKFTELQYRWGPGMPNCTNGTTLSDNCYSENYCVTNFYSDLNYYCQS